jgi:cytochrome c peroxidase
VKKARLETIPGIVPNLLQLPQGCRFQERTPIPLRAEDAHLPQVTLRNTTALIELFWGEKPGRPNLLHSDGEFETPEALVVAGLTGRNMGWLASEKAQARARVAEVARFYPELGLELSSVDPISRVAEAISAYMRSLEFSKDESGEFNGSPYDYFLRQNGLPVRPDPGEAPKQYGLRLKARIEDLELGGKLRFVSEGPKGPRLERHDQEFVFGARELEGLKIFYSAASRRPLRDSHGVGNCAGCHAPPAFTDFRFRNTGASQEEYDGVHGFGAFMRLPISEAGRAGFASIPNPAHPERADLGAWNQLGQKNALLFTQVFETLCGLIPAIPTCTASDGGSAAGRFEAEVRTASIGAFKTPTLRNLGHSGPYLHTGDRSSIASAIQMYIPMGALARKGWLRSGDPEMEGVILTGRDLAPLAAFVEALNEDYE